MKLLDIAKRVGKGIIREAIPGGSLIVDAFNAYSGQERLPKNVTGERLLECLKNHPDLQQMEFDIELEEIKQQGETVRAMIEADARSEHTTRPYVVKHSFHVVSIILLAFMAMWSYAVMSNKVDLVDAVANGWPLVLAVTAPYTTLLYAYFGILKDEHKNRLDSAHGSTRPNGLAGLLSTVFNKGKQ